MDPTYSSDIQSLLDLVGGVAHEHGRTVDEALADLVLHHREQRTTHLNRHLQDVGLEDRFDPSVDPQESF